MVYFEAAICEQSMQIFTRAAKANDACSTKQTVLYFGHLKKYYNDRNCTVFWVLKKPYCILGFEKTVLYFEFRKK